MPFLAYSGKDESYFSTDSSFLKLIKVYFDSSNNQEVWFSISSSKLKGSDPKRIKNIKNSISFIQIINDFNLL